MPNWYVGQRVRCKDARPVNEDGSEWPPGTQEEMVLVQGAEYTIRDVYTLPFVKIVVICLVEIQRASLHGIEKGWRSCRFEPIQTTSIESLRSLLNPTPEQMRQFEDELVD